MFNLYDRTVTNSMSSSSISFLPLQGAGASNPRFQNTRDAHGWGVSFLDELLFLFPSNKLGFVYKQDFKSDSASRVSTHMIMLWTNFIKGGYVCPYLSACIFTGLSILIGSSALKRFQHISL